MAPTGPPSCKSCPAAPRSTPPAPAVTAPAAPTARPGATTKPGAITSAANRRRSRHHRDVRGALRRSGFDVSSIRVHLAAIRTAHLLAGRLLDLRHPRLAMVID